VILKATRLSTTSAKLCFDGARHEGTGARTVNSDQTTKILDAVDAGFDAQLASTRDFVAIPSTRGAEGPCQDMIGDLLRQRGYEVDDWHIDVEDLKDLRGYGPISHDFSKARSVVGTYRPQTNAGKSLILQGPATCAGGPTRDVGDAAILAGREGGKMYGRAPAT